MKSLIIGLISSVLMAQQPIEKVSFGMGGHEQGLMLNATYTSPNRIGFFIGGAFTSRNDYSLPTEAYFSWVPYNREDWFSKNAFYGGPLLRVSNRFEIGVGYGSKTNHIYNYGYSTASGIPFRWGGRTETKTGPVIFINGGMGQGLGFHAIAGSSGVGLGIAYRF